MEIVAKGDEAVRSTRAKRLQAEEERRSWSVSSQSTWVSDVVGPEKKAAEEDKFFEQEAAHAVANEQDAGLSVANSGSGGLLGWLR